MMRSHEDDIRALQRQLAAAQRTIQYHAVGARILQSEALCARAYNSQAQSIAASTATALTFDTEVHDTDDIWDVTYPTKFTCVHEGYYMAGGGWALAGASIDAARRMGVGVKINGTTQVGWNEIHTVSGLPANVSVATGAFWLSADDYVEIEAYHSFTGAKNTSVATSTNHTPSFGWIARLA
jgi:hypothetical protein